MKISSSSKTVVASLASTGLIKCSASFEHSFAEASYVGVVALMAETNKAA